MSFVSSQSSWPEIVKAKQLGKRVWAAAAVLWAIVTGTVTILSEVSLGAFAIGFASALLLLAVCFIWQVVRQVNVLDGLVSAQKLLLVQAADETNHYRRTLQGVAKRSEIDFREHAIWTFDIGATPTADRVHGALQTGPRTKRNFEWRRVWGRVDSPNAGGADLSTIGFEAKPTDRSTQFDILQLNTPHEPQEFAALIYFIPPVREGELREWEYSYEWTGVWNPLRSGGRDTLGWQVLSAHESVTVRFVFPPGSADTGVAVTGPSPAQRAIESQEGGRSVWTWSATAPLPGRYEFALKMSPLAR